MDCALYLLFLGILSCFYQIFLFVYKLLVCLSSMSSEMTRSSRARVDEAHANILISLITVPWFVTTTTGNFPMLRPLVFKDEASLEGPMRQVQGDLEPIEKALQIGQREGSQAPGT